MDTVELVSKAKPAVVTVICFNDKGEQTSQGSGFIVAPDGVVATAWHVLVGAARAQVRLSIGACFEVEGLAGRDEAADFALLKVQGSELPRIPLGDSDTVRQGDRVVTLGAPLGLEETASEGIVSAVREWPQRGRVLQLTAPISPGSNGGPVLNEQGEAVGIVSFLMWQGQNLNFAVPINQVKAGLHGRTATTRLADVPTNGAVAQVVRAQRFEVVDAEGRVRVLLSMGPDGQVPSLTLHDEKGDIRACLWTHPDGSTSLTLCDEKGATRASLSTHTDGSPILMLHDEKGATRASLGTHPDGRPILMLHDEKGEVRASLWTPPHGSPSLSLHDTKGDIRASLGTHPDGKTRLMLHDEKGEVIWMAP